LQGVGFLYVFTHKFTHKYVCVFLWILSIGKKL
jgi:hypothetical protein